jgi:hypothetical protein
MKLSGSCEHKPMRQGCQDPSDALKIHWLRKGSKGKYFGEHGNREAV